jgi:DNA-binding transcriptional regulator GbsR (MarR family)
MGDMLRSSRPDPAFHDAMDEAAKPKPKPDYSGYSPTRRRVAEYRHEHGVSTNEAMRVVKAQIAEEEAEEARREIRNKWADLNAQLSCAKSVEDLKPILQEIIDKLWS